MRVLITLLAAASMLAVSLTASAPAADATTQSRIAGADRYATSVEVSRQTPSPGDVVYLASGLTFADALAAGPVAAAEGGHLLLTRPDAVPAIVMQRIGELSPSEIVLVGSAATVHETVRAQLAKAFPAIRIERIGGSDRVGTSLELLERLASTGPVNEIWVVSGHNFPDALVAASVAGATSAGIILDWHGTSAASARDWADRVAPFVEGMPVSIAGGTPSVSAADEALLAERGAVDIVRHAGTDRYDTARLINAAYPVDPSITTMLLATGKNFPDALAGAVQAAATGMPLYLSPASCHHTVTAMLAEEAEAFGLSQVIGLGSAETLDDTALALEPCPQYSPIQRAMGDDFGTFATTTVEGFGDATVPLPEGATGGLIHFTHELAGPGFSLTTFNDEGLPVQQLGGDGWGLPQTFAYLPQPDRTATQLQIHAPDAWTVTFQDLRHARELVGTATGAGDDVLLYDGAAGPLTAAHPALDFGVRQCGYWGGMAVISCRSAIVPTGHATETFGSLSQERSIVVVHADQDWQLFGPAAHR